MSDHQQPSIVGKTDRVTGKQATIYTPPEDLVEPSDVRPVPGAREAELEAEVERLTSERNIAVNTVKATTPNFDVAAARIQCEQREAADRRAWAAEAKLRDVEAVLDRVERELAAGDAWDVDEVVHDVRLAVLARSQAPQAPAEQEGDDCYCPDDHASWCPNLAPSVRPATTDDEGVRRG